MNQAFKLLEKKGLNLNLEIWFQPKFEKQVSASVVMCGFDCRAWRRRRRRRDGVVNAFLETLLAMHLKFMARSTSRTLPPHLACARLDHHYF